MDKNILLKIAYDGAGFHGWQRQPDKPTVQGHLETVLSRLFKTGILLNGTSRTDAGVHALGQQASFKADVNIPVEKLARVVNNALCGCEKGSFAISPVRIVEAEEKPPEFHARFDARGKTYIYKIRNTQTIDIFQRNYVYHVAEPLDTDAMRQAAKLLAGTHDFKSFEASGEHAAGVHRQDDLQAGTFAERRSAGTPCYGRRISLQHGSDPYGNAGRCGARQDMPGTDDGDP